MFVPTPRWAYQGKLQSLLPAPLVATMQARSTILPALAPLRRQGGRGL
jgi:hypothetical protein